MFPPLFPFLKLACRLRKASNYRGIWFMDTYPLSRQDISLSVSVKLIALLPSGMFRLISTEISYFTFVFNEYQLQLPRNSLLPCQRRRTCYLLFFLIVFSISFGLQILFGPRWEWGVRVLRVTYGLFLTLFFFWDFKHEIGKEKKRKSGRWNLKFQNDKKIYRRFRNC